MNELIGVRMFGDTGPKRSIIFMPIALLFATSSFAVGSPAEDFGGWNTIEVANVQSVAVRLHVLKKASMAEEKWIFIEFENKGDKPARVESGHYSMDRSSYDQVGKGLFSGSMASGGFEFVLPPGARNITTELSDQSSLLLGLPPREGQIVCGTITLWFNLNGKEINHELRARQFCFDWLHSDDAGFDRMRKRLKNLFDQPHDDIEHAVLLSEMLNVPEVAKSVSSQELFASLRTYQSPSCGRRCIANFLESRAIAEASRGAPRKASLAFWERLTQVCQYEQLDYAKQMVKGYKDLISEDSAWKEPSQGDLKQMTVDEKVKYWIYHLRDIDGIESIDPQSRAICTVLSGETDSTCVKRNPTLRKSL